MIDRRKLLQGLSATAASTALGSGALSCAGKSGKVAAAADASRPHILFISIDDLNDWVGILGGHEKVSTPNVDRLARRGMSFQNAHCAAPACNPSRTSTLTGIRPSTSGVYGNDQPWRRALPDAATLPQHLRTLGYRTLGCGKIFHVGDPQSWDEAWPDGCTWPDNGKRALPKDKPANGIPGSKNFDWGASRSKRDGVHSDDRVADWVIKQIEKDWDQPTFLGCGFFRPHLPWYVPQSWFDAFPRDEVVLPAVTPNDLDDIPAAGRRMARIEDHERIVNSGKWKDAVQAYMASCAFSDHQLGRVLDALHDSGKQRDTIVVLWSDHGWALGTKFHWKKFALWEECTRIPMVIAAPGLTTKASSSKGAVSLLDLYPTIVELAGGTSPDVVEGDSLVPLLRDPGMSWERPAVMTWGRNNHAVRGQRYRYIRYADGSEELYDHQVDDNEWRNLAGDDRYADVIASHAAWLPKVNAPDAPTGIHRCKR